MVLPFGIFPAPFLIKAIQFSQCDFFCWGCIYTFQISHQRFEFLVGNKLCCIPDLMDNALLDLSVRENSLNCLRKACQAVYTCDQAIFHAAVLQTI